MQASLFRTGSRQRHRRQALAALAALAAATAGLSALPGSALAQAAAPFPSHPLKIVVPYTAGGAADLLARAVADRMGKTIGQTVLVENRPGAGTAIGAEYVAHAAPDGYTLFLGGTTSLVLNPLLMQKPPYDADRDFIGVAMLAVSPLVMVVNAKSPINSVADFVKTAKAQPGKLNFGSAGNGSSLQLAGELFKSMAGIQMSHVPYKGSPPALNALMGDEVQVLFDLVLTSKPLIDGGKLKPLAVTGTRRSSMLPKVPTLQELGYKGYNAAPQYALVAPRGTPRDIIDKLNSQANTALRDPLLAQQMADVAMDVIPGKPEAVAAFMAQEKTRWGGIIKAQGIRLDP